MVILNHVLPEMMGDVVYSVMKKINPRGKFIMTTAYAYSDLRDKMIDDGINGFIVKPFKKMDLLQTINDILKK